MGMLEFSVNSLRNNSPEEFTQSKLDRKPKERPLSVLGKKTIYMFYLLL